MCIHKTVIFDLPSRGVKKTIQGLRHCEQSVADEEHEFVEYGKISTLSDITGHEHMLFGPGQGAGKLAARRT